MGSGRCPGDIVMRVERCCDTIFSLLDQGRCRSKRRDRGEEGEARGDRHGSSAWRPELDPAGTADDFLPVLIYVVLRARVPRLHSMCEYVQAFHSPVALMSRFGARVGGGGRGRGGMRWDMLCSVVPSTFFVVACVRKYAGV